MSLPSGVTVTPASVSAWSQAKSMGLTFTSGLRSAADAARVGSTTKSMHNSGHAFDFAGSPAAMKKFAEWAKSSGLFTEVLYEVADHYDHVHVGWAEGKHAAGKTYVGNHTLIDKVAGAGASVVDTATGSAGLSLPGSMFAGSLRLVMVITFILIAIIFFVKAFPAAGEAAESTAKTAAKYVKKRSKSNGNKSGNVAGKGSKPAAKNTD